jgi:hypothetical protein
LKGAEPLNPVKTRKPRKPLSKEVKTQGAEPPFLVLILVIEEEIYCKKFGDFTICTKAKR